MIAPRKNVPAVLALGMAVWLLAGCPAIVAAAADDLYRAETVVTGQREAARLVGFAACLEDVLIKVSGAQKLRGDTRLDAYKSRAADFITAFHYRDQMSGTPKRDEQGTRDRPYDLTVDFDANGINDILQSLGVKPWQSRRPVLGVFVVMEQGPTQYIVTSDARQSDLQRDSLIAAGSKRGMSIVLPDTAEVSKGNLSGADLFTTPLSKLLPVAAKRGGEIALVGRLIWDDSDLGWTTEWRMDDGNGQTHSWQLRGVTFDEAFRRGIGGAAQILSGNGDPE